MPSPLCTVVVPVYNGLEYLEPMLESLFACTDPTLYDLVLSDDGSDERTLAFLRSLEGHAKVIYTDRNRGFAAACNAGAAAGDGEFVVFLNTDLELKKGWLEGLVRVARDNPRVGAVGCKLLYPDGTIQHGGVFLREDALDRIPLIASHDHVGKPSNEPEANRRAELLAVTAAALLVRREAFDLAGGFDEGYVNGYEDVDLCLELGRQGWKTVYEPSVELVHHESKSGANRFAKSKANQRRFLSKWLGRVRPEVLVTPHLEVVAHPEWDSARAFGSTPKASCSSVRIVVVHEANVAATALTLESIFAARIGLEDAVVATCAPDDADAIRYFGLCEGYDDAFGCAAGGLREALNSADETFVAILKPGTVVTQGWLARMLPWLERDGVAAVGPMLWSTGCAQDVLSLIQEGQPATLYPNDLTHALGRAFQGQGAQTGALRPDCLLTTSEHLESALKSGVRNGTEFISWLAAQRRGCVIAKDVFVHREQWVPSPSRIAA